MTSLIDPLPAILNLTHPPLNYQIFISGISPQVKTAVSQIFYSKYMQDLRDLFENNPYHHQEEVFIHVQTVFANLQILLLLDWVTNDQIKTPYKKYLETKPPGLGLTRKELIILACALHDLAKGQIRPANDSVAPGRKYLLIDENGKTRGPGHEHGSALLVPVILKDSNLDEKSLAIIIELVDRHDRFSSSYCNQQLSPPDQRNPQNDAQVLKRTEPELALLLLIHIIADEYGATVTRNLRTYLLNDVVAKYSII